MSEGKFAIWNCKFHLEEKSMAIYWYVPYSESFNESPNKYGRAIAVAA